MSKIFYFKSKLLDFHIKFLFLEIKIYLNSFASATFALFQPYNYLSLYKIYKNSNKNNVLVIELNKFHTEILPSWLFYLKKLSYQNKIFFLTSSKAYQAQPFDLLNKQENNGYFLYKMHPRIILFCYNLGLFHNYKKVIFNSDIFYFSPLDHFSQLLNFFTNKKAVNNSIFLAHHISQSLSYKNKFINPQKQIISISSSIAKQADIKFISPLINENLFNPDAKKIEIFKQHKTFVSCGNIAIKSKDSEGLITALDQTQQFDKTINIIGKAPKALINKKDVNYCGRGIDFSKLKTILENSHFILFLLNNKISHQYKLNSLSGSLPLALNFNLIPIIEAPFAEFYCLNETNAIIYQEGELEIAIKTAFNMAYEQYLQLQLSLQALKLSLQKQSFNNLKNLIS